MNILQAAILGFVQGVAEFLPISSSGHLILIPKLFGWEVQSIVFDVVTHIATLSAIIWVLKEDVAHIVQGFFSKKYDREGVLGWKIIAATLPIVLAGLLVSSLLLNQLRSPLPIAIMLIVWAIVLWAADEWSVRTKKQNNEVMNVTWKQALIIGFAQVFALIPGTSRSGATISAGLFTGLSRQAAARFSFLLSIPAIMGAGVMVFGEAIQSGESIELLPLAVGFFTAFISGVIAIRFLLAIVQKISYRWFAIYRIILGIVILILLI